MVGEGMIKQKKEILNFSFLNKFKRGMAYKMVIGVLVVGFLFFFTSNFWLSNASIFKETPIGFSVNVSNATLTLKGWKYDPLTNAYIVDIGVRDLNVERKLEYSIGAQDSKYTSVPVEVVYSSEENFILRIPKAKKYEGVTLVIYAQSPGEKKSYATFSRLFSNAVIAENLPADFSEKDSIAFDMQCDIDVLNHQIQQAEKSIADNESIIQIANEKIAALKNRKELMIKSEWEEAEQQIAGFEASIVMANKEIEKQLALISELKEKIQAKIGLLKDIYQ